jgi:uncharacterized protein (TIGR03067 family)
MRKTTSALLALCALAALAGRADDPDPEPPATAKAELAKLKGTWTVTKSLAGKRELKMPPGLTYTFDGDKLTRETASGKAKGSKQTYKVKIDTKRRPHTIELVPESGKRGPVGIYKIEKGELSLAWGGRKAPADLSGQGAPVLVLKRLKAKE